MKQGCEEKRSQAGGVMIEALLWIGFFAMLIPVLTDLFFLSNTYLSLNQIARQAVVTNMTYPDLFYDTLAAPYTYPSPAVHESRPFSPVNATEKAEVNACTAGAVYTTLSKECVHRFIKWRVRRLFDSHDVKIKSDDVIIVTGMDANRNLWVSVDVEYDAFSYFFRGKRINVKASVPVLGTDVGRAV